MKKDEQEQIQARRTAQRPIRFLIEGSRLKDCTVCVFQTVLTNEEEDRAFLLQLKERQKEMWKTQQESDEEIESEFRVMPQINLIALIVSFKNLHWAEPK